MSHRMDLVEFLEDLLIAVPFTILVADESVHRLLFSAGHDDPINGSDVDGRNHNPKSFCLGRGVFSEIRDQRSEGRQDSR
jgi:hypothetical protein